MRNSSNKREKKLDFEFRIENFILSLFQYIHFQIQTRNIHFHTGIELT